MKMPAKYQAGYRAERKACLQLRKEGYYVIRSAGSKGMFDFAAFGKNKVRLISVKLVPFGGSITFGKETEEIRLFKVPAFCVKELWVCERRSGWHYKTIGGEHGA